MTRCLQDALCKIADLKIGLEAPLGAPASLVSLCPEPGTRASLEPDMLVVAFITCRGQSNGIQSLGSDRRTFRLCSLRSGSQRNDAQDTLAYYDPADFATGKP